MSEPVRIQPRVFLCPVCGTAPVSDVVLSQEWTVLTCANAHKWVCADDEAERDGNA